MLDDVVPLVGDRPIPTTCVKGALAGHCVNFFSKTAYEKLSMSQNFSKCQSAKVNAIFDNTPQMKDALQLFIFCVLTLSLRKPTERTPLSHDR